ncbi:TPA: hypothetical protein ACFNMG_001933, partial [Neisseria lactamica]
IYTEDDSKPAGKKRPLLNCTPKVGHLTDFRRCSFLWQNIQMNSDLPSSNTIWQETVAQEQQTIFLFLIHWYADG